MGTHREDSPGFAEQGQKVVCQGGTPDQGQIAVGNLKEGLGSLRALLVRRKACSSEQKYK